MKLALRSTRAHAQPDAAAVTNHFDRDFDAGGTASPHSAIQIRQRAHRGFTDGGDDVAAAKPRGRRRAAVGDPGDDDPTVALRGIDADPRPRRLVDAAPGAQLLDQRRQQVDRHDHVDVARHVLSAGAFDVQRADADEPAIAGEETGAAPERMRGGGENGLVEEIFPIAGEFVLGDDPRFDELAPTAGGDHHRIADLRVL